MTSTSRRQTAILGLFVVGAVAIVASLLFALGTLRESLRSRIEVHAVFEQVDGLKAGDAIWFAGVRVGRVRDVQLDASGVRVAMAIDATASPHIPQDTLARVGSDSLIGNKIVVLYEGTRGKPGLQDDGTLVAGTALSMEQMMAEFKRTNDNLVVITDNLKTVSGRLLDEEGSIGRFLSDDQLYADVTATVDGLQAASRNAANLTSDVSRFTAGLHQKGTLPHDLMNDTQIYASLVDSATSVKQATSRAEQVMDGIGDDATSPVGVLLGDEEAGQDLSETLSNLNTGSERLAENMEALQHNFLLRGYFKKKAKREAKEAKAAQEAGRP